MDPRRFAAFAVIALIGLACADPPSADDAGTEPPRTDLRVPFFDAGPQADAATAPGDAGTGGTPGFQVTFTAPAPGAIFGGAVDLSVEVVSEEPLRGVEFFAGDERFDADLAPPYASRLDSTRLPEGPTTLRASAVTVSGGTAEASLDVTIDNAPPAIRLVSPRAGEPVFFGPEGLEIEFEILDASALDSVSVSTSGLPLATAAVPGGTTYRGHLDFLAAGFDPAGLPLDLVVEISAVDTLFQVGRLTTHLTLTSRVQWSFQTLGELWGAPTVGNDGTIYFGSNDHNLYAVRPDGTEAWHYDAGAEVTTRPAFGPDGAVYFAAGQRVFCLEPDGRRRWVEDAGAAVGSSPALSPDGQNLYFGTYGARVVSLRAADGGFRWGFTTDAQVLSSPAVGPDGAAYIGGHDRRIRAIDAGGSERWQRETGGEVWGRPLLTSGGLLVAGSNDGYLYGLSPVDGMQRWELDLRGEIWGGPAEGPDGTLYVASTFRRLVAVSPQGDALWEVETGGFAQSVPVVDADGRIYVGSTDRMVYAVAPAGQVLWRFTTDGEILGSPALSPDQSTLYVGSVDRRLYALATGLPAATCPEPEMVEVEGRRVMKYEASRPDATEVSSGRAVGAACARPGVLPWTGVAAAEAAGACTAAGLVLCPSTLWLAACAGPGGADYPYGPLPDPVACNGAEDPVSGCLTGACSAVPTGARARCASPLGAFDLSGNVREWTADPSPTLGADFQIARGGSFRRGGDELRCTWEVPAETHLPLSTRADDLGFRCCTPEAAPP